MTLDAEHHSLESTTLAYLASEAAQASLAEDAYWPKWDSPWWRILLLHELGRESKAHAPALLESMRKHFLPAFFSEEPPPGKNAARNIGCFCALGTIFPALEAAGLQPDEALPWARSWLRSHVLPNGGLNCDDTQYRKPNSGSSIVATVAVLELFVESRKDPETPEDVAFIHGLARDLLSRKLLYSLVGTTNDEEKEDEEDWRKLCFPRFYFYDALRGLTAITRYAERMGTAIPFTAIEEAVSLLEEKSKRGPLRIERDPLSSVRTLAAENGEWVRRPSASFPLLAEVGQVGTVSPALEAEWQATRKRLAELRLASLITD